MNFQLKKILTVFLFNSSLFCLLFVGIQNSSNKSKVDLVLDKSISLPVSFIVGVSFISGSLMGSILNIKFFKNN